MALEPMTPTDQLDAWLARPLPRCGRTTVVAIDGPSGSGKTALAGALARRHQAQVISVEDLIPGWDGLSVAPRLLTDQVLRPISEHRPGAYRRWDWYRSAWAELVAVPPADLLIIEGCGASARPAGDFASLRVWVDAPVDVRKARGLARDGELYRPHWERWAAQEAVLFAADQTEQRAHVRVWTGPEGSFEPHPDRLVPPDISDDERPLGGGDGAGQL